mgnify:CR=1 FL=1
MENLFLKGVRARRTFYGIGKESPISDERLAELVREAVKYTPSSFNSQSGRAVLLLGAQHDALWDIVKEELKKKGNAIGKIIMLTTVAMIINGNPAFT